MPGISEKELKRNFPNLLKELGERKPDKGKPPRVRVDKGRGYDPSILDFLRRCDNDREALEIVDYLERRGEITETYAASLRKRIKEKGVRSFGEKRAPGHYFREFG
jgi:hypothetical protein